MRNFSKMIFHSKLGRWQFTILPIVFMTVCLGAVAHAQEQTDAETNLLQNDFTFTPPLHLEQTNQTNNILFKQGYLDVTLYNGWKDKNELSHPVDKTGRTPL